MQEKALLRLEGTVENIVYRNDENGYTVLEIIDGDNFITAVGVMPPVNSGDRVALTGMYTEHRSYGRQFSAKACEICRPTETADILRYLSSGAIKGVGPATAQRLVKEFGESTLEVMETQPERVALLKGVSKEKALDFAAQLRANAGIRVRAGLSYILRHNEGNGHTCLPADKLLDTAAGFLGVSQARARECLDELIFDRSLILDRLGDTDFIFTPQLHLNEMYIASRVKMMLSFPAEREKNLEDAIAELEESNGIRYADLQRDAITAALSEGMLVLTGGPGTGKTTTLNAIIKILQSRGKKVLLAAPTGRAAQRMSELTGDEAKTIHRLLEVSWDKHDNPVFNKNEKNQLKCDALIIDEMSMVDCYIFESVMRALPMGCRLVLVGDSDQLPSVGPGNILGDLIDSGVLPVVRLNEIFRQAQESLIITNAHKIVNGQMPVLNKADKDFFFLRRTVKSEVTELITDLCRSRLPKAYGYSPFENIQVLSPSKKGELGTAELNHRLQSSLNPPDDNKAEVTIGSKTFREGDKVMQIKNNYDIRWFRENGETGEGVFNGDIGIIEKIDRKTKHMRINFYDKTAALTFEDCSDIDFAYAITVHKSQGNEFDAVIIPMFSGPPQLYYRNLLYTAVTRAKKTLILVGTPQTVEYMVNNNRQTKRYSALREFLTREDSLY